MEIKVFTAFSGYDSQCLALDRLKENYPDFDYELVGWSEIDKYAIKAHNSLYPQWADRNYGDISKINWQEVPDFDLFTYSFPCTDISNAGQQKGLSKDSGTRSSLLWECQRAIEVKRPKYMLMENVSALVSKKFISDFNEWQLLVGRYGYSNFTQVMNAKDYRVPQNRNRVFMVSILGEEDYYFPTPMKLDKRLKDVLEPKVDEKYYLSKKMIDCVYSKGGKNKDIVGGINVNDGDAPVGTITANYYKLPRQGNYYKEQCNTSFFQYPRGSNKGGVLNTEICPTISTSSWENNYLLIEDMTETQETATKQGYDIAQEGDSANLSNPNSSTRRGRVGKQIANTLDTGCQQGVVAQYRIRKLTPRECFRLMGVNDAEIDKIQASGISNSQQYKLAGNSIVVDNIYHIFRKMFVETNAEPNQQLNLF